MSVAVRPSACSVAHFAVVFIGYALLAGLVGALLAWPLWLLLGVFGVGADSFHKLVLRCVQLAAVAGLWPLARVLGLVPREDYALRTGPGFAREFGNGVVLGVAGLVVLAAAWLAFGVRVPRPAPELAPLRVVSFVVVALVGAMLVATLEEIWFRGGLYGAARSRLGIVAAAIAVSALFAVLHYARSDLPIAAAEVRWWSGLEVLRHAFDRLATHERVFDSLLALFLLGLMLVALRERSGRLALPIGVHAGSVLVVRLLREYTQVDASAPTAWLVGGYDGVLGWMGALWLAVLVVVTVGVRRVPGLATGASR